MEDKLKRNEDLAERVASITKNIEKEIGRRNGENIIDYKNLPNDIKEKIEMCIRYFFERIKKEKGIDPTSISMDVYTIKIKVYANRQKKFLRKEKIEYKEWYNSPDLNFFFEYEGEGTKRVFQTLKEIVGYIFPDVYEHPEKQYFSPPCRVKISDEKSGREYILTIRYSRYPMKKRLRKKLEEEFRIDFTSYKTPKSPEQGKDVRKSKHDGQYSKIKDITLKEKGEAAKHKPKIIIPLPRQDMRKEPYVLGAGILGNSDLIGVLSRVIENAAQYVKWEAERKEVEGFYGVSVDVIREVVEWTASLYRSILESLDISEATALLTEVARGIYEKCGDMLTTLDDYVKRVYVGIRAVINTLRKLYNRIHDELVKKVVGKLGEEAKLAKLIKEERIPKEYDMLENLVEEYAKKPKEFVSALERELGYGREVIECFAGIGENILAIASYTVARN